MQVVLTYTRTRKSIHVKRNTKKRMAMSKEKHATWRAFRKQNETVMNNAAPRVTDAPEDAMHTIWNSERKVMVDGKWYIPLSEVSDVLTSTDGMGMPINCSTPTRFKKDDEKWFAKADRKQRGY